MKKTLTLLFTVIVMQLVVAQNYQITGIGITMPSNPDANTSAWGTGSSVFTINASTKLDASGNINGTVAESRILVSIKKGGGKVCGSYTNTTAPLSNFSTITKVWSGRNVVSLIGEECTLKPGDYELCVQFFGYLKSELITLSEEKCKPFSIRGEELQTYQPPQAISPKDGTVLSETEGKSPLTFRWTPVVPKPKGDVTYKVVIFEIRQGQSATEAVKSAVPLLEKEIINQAQLTGVSLNQLPIAKDSKYGWYVQAKSREGIALGVNNGMSNTNTFEVKSAAITITYFKITCGTSPNKYNFVLEVHNSGDKPLKMTTITFSPSASLLGTTIPALSLVVPAANTRTYTGTLSYFGSCPNTITVTLTGHQDGNTNLTSMDTENAPIESCFCTDCENMSWNFNLISQKVNSNKYNLAGTLSAVKADGSNLPIYGAEFQVQSYSYTAQPSSCTNGVTSLTESGMILLPGTTINNNTNIQIFNENVSLSPLSDNNISKDVKLISTTLLSNPLPVNIAIGLPGALPGLNSECCLINYKVCIKATFFYDAEHCYSCTIIKCFDFTNQ